MARHTFTNKGLAHKWFHEYETLGHGSTGNKSFYFENETIFSYGSHFPIAKIVKIDPPFPNGVDKIVLLTSRYYSSTTGRHISYVREAIDTNTSYTLTCENPAFEQHKHAYLTLEIEAASLVIASCSNKLMAYGESLQPDSVHVAIDKMITLLHEGLPQEVHFSYGKNVPATLTELRTRLGFMIPYLSCDIVKEPELYTDILKKVRILMGGVSLNSLEHFIRDTILRGHKQGLVGKAARELAKHNKRVKMAAENEHWIKLMQNSYPNGITVDEAKVTVRPTKLNWSTVYPNDETRGMQLLIDMYSEAVKVVHKNIPNVAEFGIGFCVHSIAMSGPVLALNQLLGNSNVSDQYIDIHNIAGIMAREVLTNTIINPVKKSLATIMMHDIVANCGLNHHKLDIAEPHWVLMERVFDFHALSPWGALTEGHPNNVVWYNKELDKVYTTAGLSLEAKHVRRLCKFVSALEDGELPEDCNKVGPYAVHNIVQKETIVVGCHRLYLPNVIDVMKSVCENNSTR